MLISQNAISIIKAYLDSKDVHIAVNSQNDTHGYLVENGHDYRGHVSFPITIEEAINMEIIWINDGKIFNAIPYMPTFPIELNYIKIRRRCEDYLRKTDNNMLLQVAHLFSVKLD